MILISPKHFFMLKIFVLKKDVSKLLKYIISKKAYTIIFKKYMSDFYFKKNTK